MERVIFLIKAKATNILGIDILLFTLYKKINIEILSFIRYWFDDKEHGKGNFSGDHNGGYYYGYRLFYFIYIFLGFFLSNQPIFFKGIVLLTNCMEKVTIGGQAENIILGIDTFK